MKKQKHNSAMQTTVELLESNLQSLQEMHSDATKQSEESLEDVEQTSRKVDAVTRRCQRLVTDLAEARQEEQMLVYELNQLSELRQQFHN